MPSSITITRATEHNLRSVSLTIPRNKFIVVTGVSGSGKSSLVYDVLFRESESRYLGSFSSYARQFMGRFRKPSVESVEGLSPAIALDQKSVAANPRSTVGTLTGIWDLLRLLYARTGKPDGSAGDFPVSRSLFSFNSPEGACPVCNGLGVEDFLDPGLLVEDPRKTLREGALVITAPNGYIIYSQVTLDVLDQVCRAEGFNIDIPWQDLTPGQKHIVLYGSDRIEIPYGKHPLESRMKWSGITAKPREMGYYKGILPVMETILRRDRNRNILRFVRTGPCRRCGGTRLNDRSRSVRIGGLAIDDLASMELHRLPAVLQSIPFDATAKPVSAPVIRQIEALALQLCRLGLGHLTAHRESGSLAAGDARRLRLATLAGMDLSGMICIFDEPSVGLHPHDILPLIDILKEIRDKGNTVVVVEHDDIFLRHADWITDLGPGAGRNGGEILFNGTPEEGMALPMTAVLESPTLSFLHGVGIKEVIAGQKTSSGEITVRGATSRNLKKIDATFRLGMLNVVTGLSGSGKSTLVNHTLGAFLENRLQGAGKPEGSAASISGWEGVGKVICIDSSPIGRTPRSNPATYTGLFDRVRDLFARLPESVSRGYDKSRYSFNTPGGRCETCGGAGYQQVGMHFLGTVEVLCDDCQGKRFDDDTLAVNYRGKNISAILEMTVSEACGFFAGEPKIVNYLEILEQLGLGYLSLGQRSSTLSGGEAQRIKLAAEMARPQSRHTLYIMNEPTTGLHPADIDVLLNAFDRLIGQGHTVIVTEHNPALILAAGHVIDLGPGSGSDGGSVVFEGSPGELMLHEHSSTAKALNEYRTPDIEHRMTKGTDSGFSPSENQCSIFELRNFISLKGVCTHNLKNISLSIPHNKITVITGVSGSGKTSLAYDTIHAEAQNRFFDSFSPYIRSRIGMYRQAEAEEITGLTPTFATDQAMPRHQPRSTVGTVTGIYDHYRLLFSRLASSSPDQGQGRGGVLSTLFSFNHEHGACPDCDGLGQRTVCDVEKLITDPARSLLSGALDGTRTGRFYGDPGGQYVATLRAVGTRFGIDLSLPWQELPAEARQVVWLGTGDETYDITWEFTRGQRVGKHHFSGKWAGLKALVEEEYSRKHADHRGEGMMNVMSVQPCDACGGRRLRKEALGFRLGGLNMAELADLPVEDAIAYFSSLPANIADAAGHGIAERITGEILKRLHMIAGLGLPYLSISRRTDTLSTGEARRIRLASQIGAGLTGITYILDEPSAGLHPRDTAGLLDHLRALRGNGNTLILVEHDPELILAADHVIDMGPGAGSSGGEIVATGPPSAILAHPTSVTGRYLRQRQATTNTSGTRSPGPPIHIKGACVHNLKGFDVSVATGGITVVTGVSGSGKSSLVFDVLHASALSGRPAGCREITGFEHFSRIVAAETADTFRSGLSVVASYSGMLDPIRDLMAREPSAIAAGLSKNHFSFLTAQGQCSRCEGRGVIRTSMDFLPDVETTCEHCNGSRYNDVVLSVFYRKKNMADILGMTVSDALPFFESHKKIAASLGLLERIGLGYLRLGQPLSTLSGGEAQRLHLSVEISNPGPGRVLFLFDEPSTGLHLHDIDLLMGIIEELAVRGHTLILIDHDPMVIGRADRVIELGPEGGNRGGYLIRQT